MTESPAYHQPVARWFRYCLLIAAIFNLFGAISFAPPVYYAIADPLGFPKEGSSFGLWVISSWILIFGIGYAWLFIKPKPEKVFIAVAAGCKIAIATFFFIFWLTSDLPLISLFAGGGDLIFAIIFIFWIVQTKI
ncbi:MAG TPA: hypothetical protein DCY88_29440 [Cyanobacteria bacterium UBA11372]|nr:hypothetical protein [Cyanobacteria bacterium UBA11372]